jgi:hypothetical protein
MDTSQVVVVSQEESGKTEVTVVEIAKVDAGTATPESPASVVEEIIDAILDPLSDDEASVAAPIATAVATPLAADPGAAWIAPDTTGELGSPTADEATAAISEPTVPAATEAPSAAAENPAATEAQAHAGVAADFQAQADAAVAAGDYAKASDLRESAENEAWAASDSSMLHGSDSVHLQSAAEQQQRADELQWEEGRHAAAGEYEAAREDAFQAVFATSAADFNAGASDHTGQARDEYQHMDSAVFQENWAQQDAQTAGSFAAEGDLEHASQYADSAAEHQLAADDQAALGEHGGDLTDFSASSDSGAGAIDTYDSSSVADASSSYEPPPPDISSSTDDSSV